MKKFITVLLISFFMLSHIFAQTAVFKDMKGKVQIRLPGGQQWKKAGRGMKIPKGATISTGFRSTALLSLGKNSEIHVKPLTRMTLEELVTKSGVVTTGLYIRVGTISAKVKNDPGLTHDFRLRSSVSTAAIRGTEFEYSGNRLAVFKGAVLYQNSIGQKRTIRPGMVSRINGLRAPENPQDFLVEVLSVDPSSAENIGYEQSGVQWWRALNARTTRIVFSFTWN